MDDPFLTIIVPAYNEEQRLPDSLAKITAFLETQPYASEVIVVENGSTDDTLGVAQRYAERSSFVRVLRSAKGKGAAVRKGMLEGKGEHLFICDADLAMPIDQVPKFIPPALPDYDVAIASREAPGARRFNEPWYRHLMGRVFNLLVRLLAVPGTQDTQCGFKCFRREVARDLFAVQTIDGWAFDVEILHAATRRGYRLVEVPVNWYYGKGSRVSPIRDSINMLIEVLRIHRNGRAGLYDRPGQASR
jgi:dolichyl-phosphate beta-glucosyltransferase